MSHQILNFSRIFTKTCLDSPQRRPRDVLETFWAVCDLLVMSKIHKFVHTNHVQTEKVHFVLGILHWNFWYFHQNRLCTHRDEFSADFDVWGLCLRHGDCIRQLARVTDTQKSVKTVWDDQIEWEDPARTCLCDITRRTPEAKMKSKRLQMSHKRLVLGLSVCEMSFSRT